MHGTAGVEKIQFFFLAAAIAAGSMAYSLCCCCCCCCWGGGGRLFTWCLNRITWCLNRITWCLNRITWCLNRITWCLNRITWCLNRITWCLKMNSSSRIQSSQAASVRQRPGSDVGVSAPLPAGRAYLFRYYIPKLFYITFLYYYLPLYSFNLSPFYQSVFI